VAIIVTNSNQPAYAVLPDRTRVDALPGESVAKFETRIEEIKMSEARTSKHPEMHRSPGPASVPFELPEATGDHLLGDQYARPELVELAESEPAVAALKNAHSRYREGFQRLRDSMKARDPNETEARHLTESRKVADQWLKDAAKRNDDAKGKAESALVGVKLDIRDKCGFDETPRASEVRSIFREMKPEQRITAANQAIESGDSEVMAALLNGSAMLTGLSEQDREGLKAAYVRRHAPELLKRKQTLEKALEINQRTNIEALTNYSKMFDSGRMGQISQASERSRQARQAVLDQ